MELVNKKYVKFYKFTIFEQMVKSGITEENIPKEKVDFLQKLLETVLDYERTHKNYLSEFYVNVNQVDLCKCEVSRQTIVNALVYASINGEYDMVNRITPYLYTKRYLVGEMSDILDYILEHGMSIDDYVDGEREKLIYDENTNTLVRGLIYEDNIKLERRNK